MYEFDNKVVNSVWLELQEEYNIAEYEPTNGQIERINLKRLDFAEAVDKGGVSADDYKEFLRKLLITELSLEEGTA